MKKPKEQIQLFKVHMASTGHLGADYLKAIEYVGLKNK
jgi:hypothetical protein